MTHERIIAYLLEELSEREAEQFEEECWALPEWPSDDLESAENHLIEAYVHNELSEVRRRRFEEKYLITQARKDRVLLARSSLRVLCSPSQPASTWTNRLWRFWTDQTLTSRYVSAAAVLLIGVALLFWYWIRPVSPQTFTEINLTSVASVRRANGAATPIQKVLLPLGADALKISLTLPEPAPEGATYSVEWENVKGLLKTLQVESQNATSVSVVIPADDLTPGQYTLKLVRRKPGEAEEHIGDYFFNVE